MFEYLLPESGAPAWHKTVQIRLGGHRIAVAEIYRRKQAWSGMGGEISQTTPRNRAVNLWLTAPWCAQNRLDSGAFMTCEQCLRWLEIFSPPEDVKARIVRVMQEQGWEPTPSDFGEE